MKDVSGMIAMIMMMAVSLVGRRREMIAQTVLEH